MQTLSQQIVSALREYNAPVNVHFVRGDGRYISATTIITMPNMDTSMFCGLTYDERKAIMALMALPDWRAYIVIQAAELNRFAARTKGTVTIDGVTFKEDTNVSSSGR
jgi:hypothetical protein